MEEYGIRVGQLKRLKTSIVLKLFLYCLIFIFIELLIYRIFSIYYDEINIKVLFDDDYLLFWIIEIIFLIVFISLFIVYYIYSHRRFNKFYLTCIFSECKLLEIYLLNHSVKNFKQVNSFLTKAFSLQMIRFVSSYSDASNKFSLDVNKVIYFKDKKNYKGTILSVHFDQERPGFLQITPHNKCNFEKYDNHEVIQYGMSKKSLINEYHLFSTYGSKTYVFENNEYAKKIYALEKFFLCKIDLVFDNENLYIFIPNYTLNLFDYMEYPISNNRFNDKIEAIVEMHKLLYDVIKMFDELFSI